MNWKKVSIKTFKIILKSIGYFVLCVLVYLTSVHLVSRIEVPAEKTKAKKEITIFIKSNGVHTDIVLPANNEVIDWRKYISPENTVSKDSSCQYLAFGWGDKGFYLSTPTWGELKVSTALNAAFGLSTAAVHTTYYHEMKENKTDCRKIKITKSQYKSLVNYVRSSLILTKENKYVFIKTDAIYGKTDAFYDAYGTYSMFSTCNSWSNNALISCGQKAALWTAFQGGIFCHYQ